MIKPIWYCIPALLVLMACSAASSKTNTQIHSFDLDKDLPRFFEIQAQLGSFHPHHLDNFETKQAKIENRAVIFAKYDISGESEWEKVSTTAHIYMGSDRAKQIYGSDDAIKRLRSRYWRGGSVRVGGKNVVTCNDCAGDVPNQRYIAIVSKFRDEVTHLETALATNQENLGFNRVISEKTLSSPSEMQLALKRLGELEGVIKSHFLKIAEYQSRMFSDLKTLAAEDTSQKPYYDEFIRKRDLSGVGYDALYGKRKAAQLSQIESYKKALKTLLKAGNKFKLLEAGMAFDPSVRSLAADYEKAISDFNESSKTLRVVYAQFDQLNAKRAH